MYVFIFLTKWPPIGGIAAHSAYGMFSLYKYLTVILFFSYPWNFSLIAAFLDHCLLLPFYEYLCNHRFQDLADKCL